MNETRLTSPTPPRPPSRRAVLSSAAAAVALTAVGSCEKKPAKASLVLYTSVDEPVARPVLDLFTRKTGIEVRLQTDAEKSKSVGLARRLEAERADPKADVWWGNEVFHTINLGEAGLLDAYDPPSAREIPNLFKHPQGLWTGNGLRARVLAVNQEMASVEGLLPNRSVLDLTNPKLAGRIAMAHPSAGTTSGHVAALYVTLGTEKARQFFRGLRDNGVSLLGGNSVVAELVGKGSYWVGLTDNDDVYAAQKEDGHVSLVLPDQNDMGTLTIPTTVALVRGSKHQAEAKQLVDFLCGDQVEEELIGRKFAAYSVRPGEGTDKIVPMKVDYRDVARLMKQSSEEAVEILERRKD